MPEHDARHDSEHTLTPDQLRLIDAYWRAANYLSVGQIYLMDNPLLREPLRREHIKPRLLGHWGTTPGLNFIYVHLNRLINEHDLNAIYIAGPGHGGPGLVANTYLEGTYSELYPNIPQTEAGMRRLFTQFSFPGGIPSHVAPETPGSIHEGGELGYSLLHAYGAVFDNPGSACLLRVGDGEAETGPLATSWHSNKFLNPARDGAVLPILHLNGYKIAGPTVLARIPEDELRQLLHRLRLQAAFVAGDDPQTMHQQMARTLGYGRWPRSRRSSRQARTQWLPRAAGVADDRPAHAEGLDRTERSWTASRSRARSARTRCRSRKCAPIPITCACWKQWMKSYRPEELFDENGTAARRKSPRWRRRATGAWAPTRTPMAACCCAISNCRISAITRWMCRSRVRSKPRARASPGSSSATSCG